MGKGGMGKDVFGKERADCEVAGCKCNDFVSKAQHMAKVKRGKMPSFMSCQMKSQLNLTCHCGHGLESHVHGRKQPSPRSDPELEYWL